jgi:hypothetical protein
MQRIDWVEARLVNWARWKLGGGSGGMGYARTNPAQSNAGRSGYITAPVPVLEAEAGETDQGVHALRPLGLRLTIEQVYCQPGSMAEHAQALACAEATLYARIAQAHQQLAAYLLQRQAARKAERDRVESLQRRSFPR